MIVVTGGAGFIGSNIVRGLNRHGIDDVLVVDDLTDGTKFLNLTPVCAQAPGTGRMQRVITHGPGRATLF